MLSIFSCAFWPSVCHLWRKVYLDLLPIFLIGCLYIYIYIYIYTHTYICINIYTHTYINIERELYENFVYFGNDNPLLVASLANIFSHSVLSVFCFFFMVSLAVQKLLNLFRSYLFVYFHYSRRWIQKYF